MPTTFFLRRLLFAFLLSSTFISCEESIQQGSASSNTEALDSLRNDPLVLLNALNSQIAEEPEDYALFQDRSELYFVMDSLEQSLEDIQKAISLYDKGPDLYYWKGFLSFSMDDTSTARKAFERAIGLGSQNPEVYYQLGQIYFFQQKYEQALKQYRQAADFDPDQALYIFAQGYVEESRKNAPLAIKKYVQSLEVDSSFDKSLLQLHDLYLSYHSSEAEAMKYNDQLRRNELGHPLANYNEGNYQLRRAQRSRSGKDMKTFAEALNNAILHYTIAIDNDPDFVLAYHARGMAYMEGGQRLGEAISDFEKAISIDPGYAPSHFSLASIFEATGDLKTALKHYEEAYRLRPDGDGFKKAVEEVSAQLR